MTVKPEKIELNKLLPVGAKEILSELHAHGYNGWLVGGCVRDILMKKSPSDWDLCTDALPAELLRIFPRTIPTGLKHGTVTVLINGESYEVTTLRIDGTYEDHRRPDQVFFTKNLEQDLSRRDFTMNSIAINPEGFLIDPFHGFEDIKRKRIVCVREADLRFHEDALRMLRAVRFRAQLGFMIDENTLLAIKKNHKLIKSVSPERIRIELEKILLSENPEVIFEMEAYGLLRETLPELLPMISTYQTNPYHEQTVAVHTEKALRAIPRESVLRWAILLHDVGKPNQMTTDSEGITHFYGHEEESCRIAESILFRLHFSNEERQTILRLIRHHDLRIEQTERSLRRAVYKIGEDLFPMFIEIKKADVYGQHPRYLEDRLGRIADMERRYEELKEKESCFSLKDLKISGNDLMAIGVPKGREIGRILNLLLELVLDDPTLNESTLLIEKAKEYLT